MSACLRWALGGEAEILAIGADTISLLSSTPSPPGSRVEATLLAEPPALLKVKIHASRKRDDGCYHLEGRPLDMTRDLRERIIALLGRQPAV